MKPILRKKSSWLWVIGLLVVILMNAPGCVTSRGTAQVRYLLKGRVMAADGRPLAGVEVLIVPDLDGTPSAQDVKWALAERTRERANGIIEENMGLTGEDGRFALIFQAEYGIEGRWTLGAPKAGPPPEFSAWVVYHQEGYAPAFHFFTTKGWSAGIEGQGHPLPDAALTPAP